MDSAGPYPLAELHEFILQQLKLSQGAVEKNPDQEALYFGEIHSQYCGEINNNRCDNTGIESRNDVFLPLNGPCLHSLLHVLGSGSEYTTEADAGLSLGDPISRLVGADCVIHDLSAVISSPGASRQPIHPDVFFMAQVVHWLQKAKRFLVLIIL